MKCGLSVRCAGHGGEETRRKRGWPVKHVVVNRLRELRQEAGLTQEQLAADLDVTRHTILALEVGRYVPSIGLALRLAAYFNRPLETIFWLDPHEDRRIRGQAPMPAPSVNGNEVLSDG
jgi:putative transcriptional regulator